MNIKHLRRRSATPAVGLAICTVALSLGFPIPHAFALGSDTVFLNVNAGVTYDSNLFRVDSAANPQDDTIYKVGIGLRADVPYSRQRFQANLNIYDHKYTHATDLDYVGGSGRGVWLWQIGDDWNGDLGVSLSRSLQSYSYTNVSTQRNVVQTTRYFFDPRYRIAPNFELQGGLSYDTIRNSFALSEINDYNQFGSQLGLAYVTPSGNRVGLQVQNWDVKFTNQTGLGVNNDYRDTRLSTFFDWAVTGASHFDGSVGYKQRRHDQATQRDFDGWTGSIGWNWTPTGRTGVRVFVLRDIGGVDDLVITYARTYTLAIAPTYQLTSKITLNGTAQYQDLRFFGNTGVVNATGLTGTLADRHDKISTLGIGAGYSATRVLSFGLNYTWSHRNSNVPLGSYNDNVISLTGNLTF